MYYLMLKRRLSLKSIELWRVLYISLFLAYNYIKQVINKNYMYTGRISNPEGHLLQFFESYNDGRHLPLRSCAFAEYCLRAGRWFHRFNKNVYNVLNLYSVHISSFAHTKIVRGQSICNSVSSRVNNSSKNAKDY